MWGHISSKTFQFWSYCSILLLLSACFIVWMHDQASAAHFRETEIGEICYYEMLSWNKNLQTFQCRHWIGCHWIKRHFNHSSRCFRMLLEVLRAAGVSARVTFFLHRTHLDSLSKNLPVEWWWSLKSFLQIHPWMTSSSCSQIYSCAQMAVIIFLGFLKRKSLRVKVLTNKRVKKIS